MCTGSHYIIAPTLCLLSSCMLRYVGLDKHALIGTIEFCPFVSIEINTVGLPTLITSAYVPIRWPSIVFVWVKKNGFGIQFFFKYYFDVRRTCWATLKKLPSVRSFRTTTQQSETTGLMLMIYCDLILEVSVLGPF